jgi:hypothetical protein
MTRTNRFGALCAACVAAAAVLLVGCGEKIAVPVAEGLFSVNAYYEDAFYADPAVTGLVSFNGVLYMTDGDGNLTKRNLGYEQLEQVQGLEDPVALCPDDDLGLVFVWEQGAGRLSTFTASDLSPAGAALPAGVRSVSHVCASRTGLDLVAPNAHTFLYLADPDSGVVHRFAWYEGGALANMGILCRDGGLGVRFVKDPAGMLRDAEGMLLVCDADTTRNWVIRFDSSPDLTDVSPDPERVDPWRGLAVLFDVATCNPATEADYVIGDARECGEDWTGGPSDVLGEFNRPTALALDGLGRIFVADTGNDRIQIFTDRGEYELAVGDAEDSPAPAGLGVVDVRINAETVNYAAFIFVISEGGEGVRRFISYDHYIDTNQEPPPEQ